MDAVRSTPGSLHAPASPSPYYYAWHQTPAPTPLYANSTQLEAMRQIPGPFRFSPSHCYAAHEPTDSTLHTDVPRDSNSDLEEPSLQPRRSLDLSSCTDVFGPYYSDFAAAAWEPPGRAPSFPANRTTAARQGTHLNSQHPQLRYQHKLQQQQQQQQQGQQQQQSHLSCLIYPKGKSTQAPPADVMVDWLTSPSPSASNGESPISVLPHGPSPGSGGSSSGSSLVGLCLELLEEASNPASLFLKPVVYHRQQKGSTSDGSIPVAPTPGQLTSPASASDSFSLSHSATLSSSASETVLNQVDNLTAVEAMCLNFEGVERLCRERDVEGDVLLGLEIKPFKVFRRGQNNLEEVVFSLTFASKPGHPELPGQDTKCLNPVRLVNPPPLSPVPDEEDGRESVVGVSGSLNGDFHARFAAYGEWKEN